MTEEQKLIVCYIGEKCKDWLKLSIDSVKEEADAIIFVDGGWDTMKSLYTPEYKMLTEDYNFKYRDRNDILNDGNRDMFHYIGRKYEQTDKGANGKARNCYLDFVRRNFPDYWVLVLDPDEVVDNIKQLKTDIQTFGPGIYSPKMRHLVQDFQNEDATFPEHYCPNRMFKMRSDFYYPEAEHPVLSGKKDVVWSRYGGIVIWHFAYAKHLMEIKTKYDTHKTKSQIHTKEQLRLWYLRHVLGTFPTTKVNIEELPMVIQKFFEIEDVAEEVYFKNRANMNVYHWLDSLFWKEYFKPKNVLLLGCGFGMRVFSLTKLGIKAKGVELSKWAIAHTPFEGIRDKLINQDISLLDVEKDTYDLIIGYDVLEHLEDEQRLDMALKRIYTTGTKNFVFSIPFIGNPNLDDDPTHRIKETKEWWMNKLLQHGFKIQKSPTNFLFNQQIVVCLK